MRRSANAAWSGEIAQSYPNQSFDADAQQTVLHEGEYATNSSQPQSRSNVEGSTQIVVDDLAEPEGQIGNDVCGRDHLRHRQFGNRCQGVRMEIKRAGTGPGTFEFNVFEMIFDELANARSAVDMRDDLEQEIGRSE